MDITRLSKGEIIEIELDILCNYCGKRISWSENQHEIIYIDPCEPCFDKEYKRGQEEGK